jgi:DHA3 family macrolide efflux protein-like MFS transporter
MKHPLRNPNFRILFIAQFIDGLSIGFFTIPLYWWILTVDSSGSLIAVAALVGSLSHLVASPWGGVLADRMSKKYVVIISKAFDLMFAAWIGMLIYNYNELVSLFWILGFLIVSALASALRAPSLSALLPLLLSEAQYQRGNATIGMASQFASLSAFAVAGIATGMLGVAPTLFIGVSMLLLSTLLMVFLKEPAVPKTMPEAQASEGRPNLLAGFRLLGRAPLLLSLVLTATLLNFILSPFTVILAPYADRFSAGAQGFGSLAAAIVAGKLLGLGLMNIFSVRRPLRVFVWGTLGMALGLLGLALAGDLVFAMGVILLIGTCASMMGVQLTTVFQKNVPKELMGRAVGVMSALVMGAMPAGYAIAGALLAVASVQSIFFGMAVLTALASLVWLRPGVRVRLRSEDVQGMTAKEEATTVS